MPLNTYTLNTRTLNGQAVAYQVEYPATQLVALDQNVVFRARDARQLVLIDQNVVQWSGIAAAQLVAIDQSVIRQRNDRQLIGLSQRVYDSDAEVQPTPPMCFVYIDGNDVTSRVRISGVSVTHAEDESSRADILLEYEDDAPILIPSLNGKRLDIEALTDPDDADSEPWRLFTGWIERSTYDRSSRAVKITGSDLRSERLGEEDRDDLLQLTQAVYSEVTQSQESDGSKFVDEMMRTVSGSLGYTRTSDLYYYPWDISGAVPSLTLTDNDVAYEDITVEYQTRSDIVNSVSIEMNYRYTALRTVKTALEGLKSNEDWADQNGTFIKDTVIDRVTTGFSPWVAIDYNFYEMPTWSEARALLVKSNNAIFIYKPNTARCMGYTANMERYIAQPVTESYILTVSAPQSVRAYGKEITGSTLNFSVDANADFDRSEFEDRETQYTPTTVQSPSLWWYSWPVGGTIVKYSDPAAVANYLADVDDGEDIPVVDTKRDLFKSGLRAATLIAEKEIKASHRQNFIETKQYSLVPVEVGDVVKLDTRIISSIGRCTGITYNISDAGGMETQIKTQISSMNDNGVIPVEDWTAPLVPPLTIPGNNAVLTAPRSTTPKGSINYNTSEKTLDVTTPTVSEDYTDEGITEITHTYEVALENQDITLINGW